jgi:hypothetical protein
MTGGSIKDQLDHIVVRPTVADDAAGLATLAQLDSAPFPTSPGLVAEFGGRIVAYVSSRGDAVVADPFVPTANLVALLRLRVAQRTAAADAAGRRAPTQPQGCPDLGPSLTA